MSINSKISSEGTVNTGDMVNSQTAMMNDSRLEATLVKTEQGNSEQMNGAEKQKTVEKMKNGECVKEGHTNDNDKEGVLVAVEESVDVKEAVEAEQDTKNMKNLISKKIQENLCYEAHHMIKTIINRTLKKKDVDKCIKIIFHYCPQFAEKKEYICVSDLMLDCINILKEYNVNFTEQCAAKILEIFRLCPPKSSEEKYKFMNKAIVWSKSATAPYGYLPFHAAVGNAYLEDDKYYLAHNHFIYIDDSEKLYAALSAWQGEGYPSEAPYFLLRSVLSLILLKKFDIGFDIIDYFEDDLDKKEVILPVQVAYLINSACSFNSLDIFEEVKYKYRLILNFDPDFKIYLKDIESVIFKKQKKDIFSLLQNLLK